MSIVLLPTHFKPSRILYEYDVELEKNCCRFLSTTKQATAYVYTKFIWCETSFHSVPLAIHRGGLYWFYTVAISLCVASLRYVWFLLWSVVVIAGTVRQNVIRQYIRNNANVGLLSTMIYRLLILIFELMPHLI